jgi:hypothetical protein
MGALAVDVTKSSNTKTFGSSSTITFTGSPATGQYFGLIGANSTGAEITITLPASIKDAATGEAVANFTIPANGERHVLFRYNGSEYRIYQGGGTGGGGSSLTATYVVYGNGSNALTGEAAFTYNATTDTLKVGAFEFEGTTVDGNDTSLVVTDPTAARTVTIPDASGYVMLSDAGPLGSTRIPYATATDTLTAESVFTYTAGTDTLAVPNLTLSTGGALGASTATTPSAGDDDTSVATTAFVQDEVDGTRTGSHASPYTTASAVSPTWSGPFHAVYMGVAQTVNLPAAASYDGRGIMIYNTGAFVITVQPNGSEVVVLDGTADGGGTTFTLASGAGNYVSLISDGTRWITLGYKGTLTP